MSQLIAQSFIAVDRPEPRLVAVDRPESGYFLSAETRSSRSVFRYPSLVYSVRDATLVSARTAGIPKPTHSNTPGPELIPLSEALPMMGIVLCCVWTAYTTTELPEVAASTGMYPEVAADDAIPLGVVTLAAVSPQAMMPASDSCTVVAPSK